MKKEIRKNRARIAEINARLGEMADLLDTNKRSLTPDEITERVWYDKKAPQFGEGPNLN